MLVRAQTPCSSKNLRKNEKVVFDICTSRFGFTEFFFRKITGSVRYEVVTKLFLARHNTRGSLVCSVAVLLCYRAAVPPIKPSWVSSHGKMGALMGVGQGVTHGQRHKH